MYNDFFFDLFWNYDANGSDYVKCRINFYFIKCVIFNYII